MEMVNQMSLHVSNEPLQSNNGVCVTKIKIQRIMSDEKRKEPLICQSEHHCSNITQKHATLLALIPLLVSMLPNGTWVSKYWYILGGERTNEITE
jgi:hypothetical protein